MNDLHVPALTLGHGPRWAVYCLACSDLEQEYVYPCRVTEWTPEPPPVLVPEPEKPHTVTTIPPTTAEAITGRDAT